MPDTLSGDYPVTIPSLLDDADITAAFKLYHYGSTNPSNIEPNSITSHLNGLSSRIGIIESEIGSVESGVSLSGGSEILSSATSVVGLRIRGANGQTANLLTFRNAGGTTLSSVDSLGRYNGPIVNSNITGGSIIDSESITLTGNQTNDSFRARNIRVSTSNPTGGNDGDVWLKY
jgi:hypothetical protein